MRIRIFPQGRLFRGRIGDFSGRSGFSLVEVMVSMAIFSVIVVLGVSILGQASMLWRKSVEQAKTFQSARLAFDLVTRNLGQATLNTYLDYVDGANRFPSDIGFDSNTLKRYARRSDLHFVAELAGENGVGRENTGSTVFFQAPLGYAGSTSDYSGLDQLLAVCGYYVEFGDNTGRPGHTPSNAVYRYRLKQMLVPSQDLTVFSGTPGGFDWFKNFTSSSHIVADNIIAFVLRCQYPNESDPLVHDTVYKYDSREDERANPQPPTANQLPPLVQVTMVAIDESSARRLENGAVPPSAIEDALAGKFQSPSQYESDLEKLKAALVAAKINYFVFSNTVPIRESKWSK